MSLKVHLLYFQGCPNVDEARGNLRKAFAAAGLSVDWSEVDVGAEGAPRGWRGFPSPTILVDGKDLLTGASSALGESSCRLRGAPDISSIYARSTPYAHRKNLVSLSAVPVVAASLLPAAGCPACLPALGGLLSAVGLGAAAGLAQQRAVIIAFLLMAVSGMLYQGKRSGDYRPLVPGLLGAAGLYAALFVVFSTPLKVISIALLMGASVWNAWGSLRNLVKGRPDCPACEDRSV